MIETLMDFLDTKVIDTLSVIDATKVSELYADMIDKQATQFNVFLVAIGIVFAIVIGSTWWWNYSGSKAKILKDIDDGLKRYQRLFNSNKSSMEKAIEEEINKQVKILSNDLQKQLEEYKKTTTESIDIQRAELNRVFALHCDSTKSFFIAATWWYRAARLYSQTENGDFSQISVNAGIASLKKAIEAKTKIDEDNIEKMDSILSDVDTLPDYLASQKQETKKLIKKLRTDNTDNK